MKSVNRGDLEKAAIIKQLDVAIMLLALVVMALNAWLLARHLMSTGIAGCGGGGCDGVLDSRWSQVFLVPVAVCGILTYAAVMGAVLARRMSLLGWATAAILGAAVWLIFTQAVLIGRFCPWCMTAHGIGLVVVVLGAKRQDLEGIAAGGVPQLARRAFGLMLALGLAQVYGPAPATYRVDDVAGGNSGEEEAGAPIHARGEGRKVAFLDGYKRYNPTVLPHLGPADAKRVMVEYFDYSCVACARMSQFIDALRANHSQDICVIVLPVPLDRSCNRYLDKSEVQHEGSCETAKLALAVWRTKPEAFPELHQWLLQGRTQGEIRAKVLGILPQAELDVALADPWIGQLLEANIKDWVRYSSNNKALPKLLITGKRVLHGLPSGKDDFIRVMESELGL